MLIFEPVFVVGGVGLFFGLVLGYASKKLSVHVDPRIEEVLNVLPSANCGACGYPGCSAFAMAVVNGETDAAGCIPGGASTTSKVAEILGHEESEGAQPLMAVVHCKGGDKEAKDRSVYHGIIDCRASAIAGNGSKLCEYGCLGDGTCVRACPFDALHINDNGVAEVNPEKCTGCQKCVSVCPRDIISMIPKVHKIFLACSNHDRGAKVKKECTVGCTGCTLCVKATPSGAIKMEKNLPILDYSKDENFITAKHKCPSDCFLDLVKARPKANIDTKCDGCTKCVEVCPVKGAIEGSEGERHVINKAKCIGCGICLDSCHVHAISLWGGLGYSPDDVTQRQRSGRVS